MAKPKDYQFDLPSSGRPSNVTIPETWFPGVQDYWQYSTSARMVDPIDGIKAVVIHATAGYASSHAVDGMHPPAEKKVSFHWLVPDENEPQHGQTIWACVRERDAAWHVRTKAKHPNVNGDQENANHWSLGIEIVNLQKQSDQFSAWQVAVTAQIVRYCWAKYPNLKHVVSHARLDPTRREDPGSLFPWDRFKQLVLEIEDPLSTVSLESLNVAARAALEIKGNASWEQEEANSELEDPKADKFHEINED